MISSPDNPIYKTADEIKNAIDLSGYISGVIEIEFFVGNEDISDIENFNDYATNCLIGAKYGYLLEDIDYKLVGCNTVDQTILIEVLAYTDTLMKETDYLTELDEQHNKTKILLGGQNES